MFKNCVLRPNVNTVKWMKKAGIRALKTMAPDHGWCDWSRKCGFSSRLEDSSFSGNRCRSGKCTYQCSRNPRSGGRG